MATEQAVNNKDPEPTVHGGELELPRVLLQGAELFLKTIWSNWANHNLWLVGGVNLHEGRPLLPAALDLVQVEPHLGVSLEADLLQEWVRLHDLWLNSKKVEGKNKSSPISGENKKLGCKASQWRVRYQWGYYFLNSSCFPLPTELSLPDSLDRRWTQACCQTGVAWWRICSPSSAAGCAWLSPRPWGWSWRAALAGHFYRRRQGRHSYKQN